MVSNLNQFLTNHFLLNQTTVAYQFAAGFQDHCPQSYSVFNIALAVPFDPFADSGAIERCWVKTHGLRIRKNGGQSINIGRAEFSQYQSFGLENSYGFAHIIYFYYACGQETSGRQDRSSARKNPPSRAPLLRSRCPKNLRR